MEQNEFHRALSDFTFDVASGGAIRHLADLGYTVKQIQQELDFPTPYERIREAVWKHLIETGVIQLEEPGKTGTKREKIRYVREYGAFGKPSFRRVVERAGAEETDTGREAEEGEAYIPCELGLIKYRDPEMFQKILAVLDKRQAEYIDGLPWERRRVWHRADERMLAIRERLRTEGLPF